MCSFALYRVREMARMLRNLPKGSNDLTFSIIGTPYRNHKPAFLGREISGVDWGRVLGFFNLIEKISRV